MSTCCRMVNITSIQSEDQLDSWPLSGARPSPPSALHLLLPLSPPPPWEHHHSFSRRPTVRSPPCGWLQHLTMFIIIVSGNIKLSLTSCERVVWRDSELQVLTRLHYHLLYSKDIVWGLISVDWSRTHKLQLLFHSRGISIIVVYKVIFHTRSQFLFFRRNERL